jgi:hypothetical protein
MPVMVMSMENLENFILVMVERISDGEFRNAQINNGVSILC